MFKEQMNKFKDLVLKKVEESKGQGKTNKRKIENLVVFLIILIVTLIIINSILKSDKVDTKEEQSPYKILAENEEKQTKAESTELETKLEKILETMTGVRKSKSFSYIYKFSRNNTNV